MSEQTNSPISKSPLEKNKNKRAVNNVSQYNANISKLEDQAFISNKKIEKYIEEKKEIYDILMLFIENTENDTYEKDCLSLIDNIFHQSQEEEELGEKIEQFFQLIVNIANNHHREKTFFNKIYQIIENYQYQIKQTFSNRRIFDIFKSNKKILLFLFENKIITIDSEIYKEIEYNENGFIQFFYPEFKEFLEEGKRHAIEKELLEIDPKIFESFDQKRHEGENDGYIYHLIRNDLVEDFISHVIRSNFNLKSNVKPSIFETNSFLNEQKNTTLIEYSAFFGSIQIFQYLRMNDVELKPSLWLYAIHSQNAELIHLLESFKVGAPSYQYDKCFREAIKCHHNEIANYIENNFDIKRSDGTISNILCYHNYSHFPSNLETGEEFFYLCKYKYSFLIEHFMKKKEEGIISHLDEMSNKIKEEIGIENLFYLLQKEDSICDNCFKGNKNISKVAIPSSIKKIGNYAFRGCSSLKEVVIPASVTSIGEGAFFECSSLTQIVVPSSVVSIGEDAFGYCSKLKEVSIPLSVTSIERSVFQYCSSLAQITFPPSVTEIENCTFQNCASLDKVVIPSSVISIGAGAFSVCYSLSQISIPSSVTSIGQYAFSYCISLEKLIIPSSVKSIGFGAFFKCESLEEITIPQFVVSDKNIFSGCSSLKLISFQPTSDK